MHSTPSGRGSVFIQIRALKRRGTLGYKSTASYMPKIGAKEKHQAKSIASKWLLPVGFGQGIQISQHRKLWPHAFCSKKEIIPYENFFHKPTIHTEVAPSRTTNYHSHRGCVCWHWCSTPTTHNMEEWLKSTLWDSTWPTHWWRPAEHLSGLYSLSDTQNESISLVNLVIGGGEDEFWSMIKRNNQENHNKRL